MLVAPARQRVDLGLVHILQHRIAAAHVAVQRRVADRHLGLVAGGDQQVAELVGEAHQQQAAHARLQVLLGDVALQPREQRRQRRLRPGDGRLDVHRVQPHAQQPRRFGGVVEARRRGEPRRQPYAAHALRSQRIHGHRGGERRVDAARHAQQHAGKVVLPHVVAQAEHHRVVDGREARLFHEGRVPVAVPALVRPRPSGQRDAVLPGRQHLRQLSIRVDNERPAVEHQLVLSADLVHVDQRQPALVDAFGDPRQALLRLVDLEGRAVGHDQQLGVVVGQVRRHGREPHVLADWQAQADAAELHRLRQRAWPEHALLVEHAVVGEFVLVAHLGVAVDDQRHRVVQRRRCRATGARRRGRASAGTLANQLVEDRRGRVHQRRPQHQVLRWVADQEQLGEDDEVGAQLRRPCRGPAGPAPRCAPGRQPWGSVGPARS